MQPTVTIDPLSLWQSLLSASAAIAKEEPALNEILKERLSCHSGYQEALGNLIAQDLSECSSALKNTLELVNEALNGSSNMISSSIQDLVATQERDPACKNLVEAFLFYRGFKALQAYRVAHYFWSLGRPLLQDTYSLFRSKHIRWIYTQRLASQRGSLSITEREL